MSRLLQIIVGVTSLGIVLSVLRARPGADTLRLVAPNAWVLGHLCRATSELLRAGPAPARVELDLSELHALDDADLLLLARTCAQWQEAGARVAIRANESVARAIAARAVLAEHGVEGAGAVASQTDG